MRQPARKDRSYPNARRPELGWLRGPDAATGERSPPGVAHTSAAEPSKTGTSTTRAQQRLHRPLPDTHLPAQGGSTADSLSKRPVCTARSQRLCRPWTQATCPDALLPESPASLPHSGHLRLGVSHTRDMRDKPEQCQTQLRACRDKAEGRRAEGWRPPAVCPRVPLNSIREPTHHATESAPCAPRARLERSTSSRATHPLPAATLRQGPGRSPSTHSPPTWPLFPPSQPGHLKGLSLPSSTD